MTRERLGGHDGARISIVIVRDLGAKRGGVLR